MPGVIFLFAVFWAYKGWFEYGFWENGGPGGGFLAVVVGLLCAFLCVLELIKGEKSSGVPVNRKHFIPFLACIIMLGLIKVIGMTLSFGLFMIVWLMLLEKFTFMKAAIAGLSTAGMVYLLFKVFLHVPLPAGYFGI